jgi:ribosomal protein S18 acetylase RimI-like enzyme
MQLTLWRDLAVPIWRPRQVLAPFTVVPCDRVSATAMGDLHHSAYDQSRRMASRDAARDDIQAALDGHYGTLIEGASLAVLAGSAPVAVIQTVLRAPWEDVQAGPFVIELFTAPAQQRRGLGRFLLTSAIAACCDLREPWLGLRVDSDNESALRLYASLGFCERVRF